MLMHFLQQQGGRTHVDWWVKICEWLLYQVSLISLGVQTYPKKLDLDKDKVTELINKVTKKDGAFRYFCIVY